MARLTTGIRAVDDLVGGVRLGDNIVLEVEEGGNHEPFVNAFVKSCQQSRLVYVSFHVSPVAVLERLEPHWDSERFVLVDCFTDGLGEGQEVFKRFYRSKRSRVLRVSRITRPSEPEEVARTLSLLETEMGKGTRYVFDSLTGMQKLWGGEKALGDFLRSCPRLFSLRTIAYWLLHTAAHDASFLAQIFHATQIALALSGDEQGQVMRVVKAEGRAPDLSGKRLRLKFEDGNVRPIRDVSQDRARLSQALRSRRVASGLSQAEMARLLGISPSALSQAERGLSGLSGATQARLWQMFGAPETDGDLSDAGARTVFRAADRERRVLAPGLSSEELCSTPSGARMSLVTFAPGSAGNGAPFPTKRDEVVFVLRGKLHVRLAGGETVLEEGDALVLSDEPLSGWSNPLPEEAVAAWTVLT